MRTLIALSLFIVAFAAAPLTAHATSWDVVRGDSRIGFSGTHAGAPFQGTFKTWSAEITFDPEALDQAKATVTVDLASAETGNTTYDKSLPSGDWFNTGSSATATYTTDTIARGEGGSYVADGTLSLRGKQVPVTLTFDLAISGDTATMTGKSTIARLDFDIGRSSDAKGAWVSLDIPLDLKVVAKRAD